MMLFIYTMIIKLYTKLFSDSLIFENDDENVLTELNENINYENVRVLTKDYEKDLYSFRYEEYVIFYMKPNSKLVFYIYSDNVDYMDSNNVVLETSDNLSNIEKEIIDKLDNLLIFEQELTNVNQKVDNMSGLNNDYFKNINRNINIGDSISADYRCKYGKSIKVVMQEEYDELMGNCEKENTFDIDELIYKVKEHGVDVLTEEEREFMSDNRNWN